MNLALNARDAMPRGGRLAISVRPHEARAEDTAPAGLKPGRYLVFTVADTGMGMPPEVLARAFEPFYTTKDAGKGSGLGLSMVYGFVRQSGGQLEVDSRLGYGTRIDLYLPAAESADVAGEKPDARADHGRETVLVVEDEPEVRGVAIAFLKSLGYSVHAAPDARAALELLAAHAEIGLVFSDVVLGAGMNGVELAHEARRLRPGIPVLLTSGYEREMTADAPYELLRKPYRREELARALRVAVAGGGAS